MKVLSQRSNINYSSSFTASTSLLLTELGAAAILILNHYGVPYIAYTMLFLLVLGFQVVKESVTLSTIADIVVGETIFVWKHLHLKFSKNDTEQVLL